MCFKLYHFIAMLIEISNNNECIVSVLFSIRHCSRSDDRREPHRFVCMFHSQMMLLPCRFYAVCAFVCRFAHAHDKWATNKLLVLGLFVWRYVHLSMCSICLVKGEPLMCAKCEKLNLQRIKTARTEKSFLHSVNVTVFRVMEAQVPIIVRMNENRGNHSIRARKHSKGKR